MHSEDQQQPIPVLLANALPCSRCSSR